ncbi:hypothetical protein [Dyadobacter sp. MSC1_007]|uniref:hypothetical protein n=1 Tax=Dyadobacter sp. MSC1_007 TaxID=2909264 RepID=UPI00202EC772|nr:hypothetical protein [Dyadobacter sp. MSC1_007]
MTKRDLKNSLHAIIDGINDTSVLEAYLFLLSQELRSQEDFWDTLDDQTKAAIEEGIADADADAGRDTDFFQYMKTAHGVER